jgi:hypothetical protein
MTPESTPYKRAQQAFVSRDREIDLLWKAFENVCAGSGPRILLLSGESGVGKTRLAQQFFNKLSTQYDAEGSAGFWPDALATQGECLKVNPDPPNCENEAPMPFLWCGVRFADPAGRNATAGDEILAWRERLLLYGPLFVASAKKKLGLLDTAFAELKRITRQSLADPQHLAQAIISEGLGNLGVPFADTITKGLRSLAELILAKKRNDPTLSDLNIDLTRMRRQGNELGLFHVVYNDLKAKEQGEILPTVILLDDAQWASADFAILLHRLLVDAEKDCWPLLVVATCWPDDLRRAEAFLANQPMPKDPAELERWIEDPRARLGVLLSAKAEKVDIGRFPATGAGSLEQVVREAFLGLNERQRNILLQASTGSPRHLLLLIKELQECPIWFVNEDMTRALREEMEEDLQELAAKRVEDLIRDQIDRAGENVKAGIAFGSHIGPTFLEEFAQRLAKEYNRVVNSDDFKQAYKPFGFVEPRSGNDQDRIFEFTYRIFHSVAQTILYRKFGDEPDLNRILGQVLAEWLGQDEIWEAAAPRSSVRQLS